MGDPAVVNQARQAEAAAVAEVVRKYIEPRAITVKRGSQDEVEVPARGDSSGATNIHT
jgi:hypothetical protein